MAIYLHFTIHKIKPHACKYTSPVDPMGKGTGSNIRSTWLMWFFCTAHFRFGELIKLQKWPPKVLEHQMIKCGAMAYCTDLACKTLQTISCPMHQKNVPVTLVGHTVTLIDAPVYL